MSVHYKFGGSTAERTIHCSAWPNLAKNMPGGTASMAAMEGTLMHLLFEKGIEDPEFEPALMLDEERMIEGQKLVVTGEHVEKVYTALDVLDEVEDTYRFHEVLPEVIMNTDDDTGGTADIIAYTLTNKRHTGYEAKTFGVGDLKTGDGYMVYAENNNQLLFYAWQAVEKYKAQMKFTDDTKFVLFIIQPSERRDNPLDIWETDLKTILKFAERFKRARKEAKAGNTIPHAGSHCAYCPAMSTCPAKTGMVQASLRIPKGSVELEDLVKAMAMVDDVEDWCRAVRKCAHEQSEAGVKIPGFKLVDKRATRVWNSEAEAKRIFKSSPKFTAEDYLDMKMKSAPQMEKVCKAKGVDFKKYQSIISLHSSGTTLVKDSDKREAVLPLPALQQMAAQIK